MKRHLIFDKFRRFSVVDDRHLVIIQFNRFLQPKCRVTCFSSSFITRVRNYCVLSGRANGVFRFSKMSRQFTRDHISRGFLCGFRKSSW